MFPLTLFTDCRHYVLDPLVLNVYIYTNWTSTQPVLEHSSKVLRLPTVVVRLT